MDLTPDGPLGERDKDMNTLPTETVGTTHHGSTGSDQAGKPAEGLQETKELAATVGGIRSSVLSVCGVGCRGQEGKIWNLDRQLGRPANQASRHKMVDALRRTAATAIPGRTISEPGFRGYV